MKKKFISAVFIFLMTFSILGGEAIKGFAEESAPQINCKSAYLMDYDSATCVFSHNENERMPIASMCKIMTLILCFDEMENGNLSLDTPVTVSENAASMGGSQIFLKGGLTYDAGELIKSIIVCSANDSCVAMAEHICGSVDGFVSKMNERANDLNARDTLFANCTGLPKETQYSTAHDVALMLKELLTHGEYYNFSKIWTERFAHPDSREIEMTNTNKLIRQYTGCDGGKTGFTNQAGFCLAATAKRGDLRLISVVIGADSSKDRFTSIKNMFDYAFANYTQKILVDDKIPLNDGVKICGGKSDSVKVIAKRRGLIFSKKNEPNDGIEIVFIPDKNIKAPVKEGDVLGEIIIFKNSIEYDKIPAIACESVDSASYGDYIIKIAEGWNF